MTAPAASPSLAAVLALVDEYRKAVSERVYSRRDLAYLSGHEWDVIVNAEKVKHAALVAELRRLCEDRERLEWIIDNATSVSDGYGPDGELMHGAYSTHGRVMLVKTTLPTIPRESKDWTRAAIDAARLTPEPAHHDG